MTDMTKSCLKGGKRHRVDERALEEARAHAAPDGTYTVLCEDCGQAVTKGPTDLTGSAGGPIAA